MFNPLALFILIFSGSFFRVLFHASALSCALFLLFITISHDLRFPAICAVSLSSAVPCAILVFSFWCSFFHMLCILSLCSFAPRSLVASASHHVCCYPFLLVLSRSYVTQSTSSRWSTCSDNRSCSTSCFSHACLAHPPLYPRKPIMTSPHNHRWCRHKHNHRSGESL